MNLAQLDDPRSRRGRRWPLLALLTAVLAGLVSGRKDLREVEAMTAELSNAARRWLKIPRRIADTTLRELLCKLGVAELRLCLHSMIMAAHRRKALKPHDLPFGVLALDGKETALTCEPGPIAQKQQENTKLSIVRTVTCTLVSSAAKVCVDVIPIPAETNEMGRFEYTLRELLRIYGNTSLFQVVSYDAGGCSEYNARLVVGLGRDYLFGLKGSQPTLLSEAKRLLESRPAALAEAVTDEARGSGTWVRRVYTSDEMAGYLDWEHLQTVVRVESERLDKDGKRIAYENRYFLASMERSHLTAAQWLSIVRSHWGVENQTHNTLDTAFVEDKKPWIEADEQGMLAVLVLRRMAYNTVALFRSVTQRSEEKRQTPWRDLLRGFYNTMIAATGEQLAELRRRTEPLATP
jgi:predicted transposase YbfD/YdcC